MKNFKAILSVNIFLFLLFGCLEKGDNPCIYTVFDGKNDEYLYIHKWNWGINGNNQLIAISPVQLKSKDQVDQERDYLYVGEFPIFLNLQNDSLLIYTFKKSNKPTKSISTHLVVKQIEIDNIMNMRLIQDSVYINLEKICSVSEARTPLQLNKK